jgi:hypothetical protein
MARCCVPRALEYGSAGVSEVLGCLNGEILSAFYFRDFRRGEPKIHRADDSVHLL